MRHFKRILSETGDEIIKYSKFFFKNFEKPEAIKIDNGFAMAGSSPHPRAISKVALWYLSQKVIPIYSVPRTPFSQASIEGNNSVFSRKFWNRIEFKSLKEVDKKLKWFNKSSDFILPITGFEQTVIKYKSGKENEAKKIKEILKREVLLEESKVQESDIILIIGKNFKDFNQ